MTVESRSSSRTLHQRIRARLSHVAMKGVASGQIGGKTVSRTAISVPRNHVVRVLINATTSKHYSDLSPLMTVMQKTANVRKASTRVEADLSACLWRVDDEERQGQRTSTTHLILWRRWSDICGGRGEISDAGPRYLSRFHPTVRSFPVNKESEESPPVIV